ncbi:MAG: hypothetical protein IKN17_02435 [Ruminococcus sp.]|nr:hypothetical protein [Ruminococcus sp.]
MNIRKLTALLCAAVMMLAGCAEPDSSSDTRKYEFKPCTEVLAEKDLPEDVYGNLILPAGSITNSAEAVYTFEADWGDAVLTEKHRETLAQVLSDFTGKSVDKKELARDGSYGYRYSDDEVAGFIVSTGSFGVSRTDSGTAVLNNYAGTERVIHLDRGENTGISYPVNGVSCSVDDAVADSEAYLQRLGIEKYLSPGERLSPKCVSVIKTYGSVPREDEEVIPDTQPTYCYRIYYSILKDGIPYTETGGIPSEDGKGFPYSSFFSTVITEKGKVGAVEFQAYITAGEKTQYNGELLSCKGALDRLSDYLAEYKEYQVPEVGAVYCAIAREGDGKLSYRPMWRVILEEYPEDANIQLLVNAAYIDMINGDIYVFDDSKAQMTGTDKSVTGPAQNLTRKVIP